MPEWNEEHLAILRQGVDAWNTWRKANPSVRPDLEDANLADLSLVDGNFSHASLLNTNMRGVEAARAKLYSANLGAARLNGADLTAVFGAGTGFRGALMSEARMRNAQLLHCDFTGAEMIDVDLRGANLEGAIFGRSDLRGVQLAGSHLGGTIFGGIDFRQVQGLEEVIHRGPSTIGIDSLVASEGAIPEVFLRGAGVSDAVIEYAAALVARPIQFYSCFISYSQQDEPLARRLHADLQKRGVRCWFAPEDLKIGDKFRQRIDESIRMYEKLLLILSAGSIASSWVETEVEAAFEKERRTGRLVLFPIRLDDAVMETDAAFAAEVRRTRHIGDFREWKQQDGYAAAFERLMRDLKADPVESV